MLGSAHVRRTPCSTSCWAGPMRTKAGSRPRRRRGSMATSARSHRRRSTATPRPRGRRRSRSCRATSPRTRRRARSPSTTSTSSCSRTGDTRCRPSSPSPLMTASPSSSPSRRSPTIASHENATASQRVASPCADHRQEDRDPAVGHPTGQDDRLLLRDEGDDAGRDRRVGHRRPLGARRSALPSTLAASRCSR